MLDNMEKPEYCMGHWGAGTPAVQATENPPLSSPGRNFVVDVSLQPRHEAATHPYPSSMPGAGCGGRAP